MYRTLTAYSEPWTRGKSAKPSVLFADSYIATDFRRRKDPDYFKSGAAEANQNVHRWLFEERY